MKIVSFYRRRLKISTLRLRMPRNCLLTSRLLTIEIFNTLISNSQRLKKGWNLKSRKAATDLGSLETK